MICGEFEREVYGSVIYRFGVLWFYSFSVAAWLKRSRWDAVFRPVKR
jgi:hypothetical protein